MRSATSNSELMGSDGAFLLQRAEDLMARFPESAAEIMPGIRGRILRKFRYSLIYTIERDSLLVLAVAHHSRRPGYWVGRGSPTQGERESSA